MTEAWHRLNWAELRQELLGMAEHDLSVRAELVAEGTLFDGYHPRMQAVHDAHAARLTVIMDAVGWPGEPQVGRDGAEAAWLIVQHAVAQPALQRRALVGLQAAVARGDAPAHQAAMLEDRIRTLEGRPQRYGTQVDWNAQGVLNPLPIEDPAGLEARRRAVGLGPLDATLATQRRAAAEAREQPPADWGARQRDLEAWLRATGWRA